MSRRKPSAERATANAYLCETEVPQRWRSARYAYILQRDVRPPEELPFFHDAQRQAGVRERDGVDLVEQRISGYDRGLLDVH